MDKEEEEEEERIKKKKKPSPKFRYCLFNVLYIDALSAVISPRDFRSICNYITGTGNKKQDKRQNTKRYRVLPTSLNTHKTLMMLSTLIAQYNKAI